MKCNLSNWVISFLNAVPLWTVVVWLVQWQAVSEEKLETKSYSNKKIIKKSRKTKVCLWHGFLCHFWPSKGIWDALPSFKSDTGHMSKCACLQKCCAVSSATRLTPRCPRVIRQEYSELYQWKSQDLHSAMRFHPHVNPYDTCCIQQYKVQRLQHVYCVHSTREWGPRPAPLGWSWAPQMLLI